MSPEGEFLVGNFAILQKNKARKLMNTALTKWKRRSPALLPVPEKDIAIYGGGEPQPGGVKLKIAYRDLPRGDIVRPANAHIQNPYNLGWYDLSASEAQRFRTDSREPVAIPEPLFLKLATTTLKDAVRGQTGEWDESALRGGSLTTQMVSPGKFQLKGTINLTDGTRSFVAQLYGQAVYNKQAKKFVEFELVAVGQRTGKNGANGRANDLGPAPMGVAFRLFATD